MGRLVFTAITSLDGYIADEHGGFDWAAPDEQVHAAVNDLERPNSTYLYGRRLYDVMAVWETMDVSSGESAAAADYAQLWQAADKVVFSRTLETPTTARTRIERSFDATAVRELKVASERDLSIGGPELANQALRAGLVDELRLFVHPVVVGGGSAAIEPGVRLRLNLLDERQFASGVVQLRYDVR
jgi:dihydrofolate reductase